MSGAAGMTRASFIMWISGRRSFRPDSGFYRDQRRWRLRLRVRRPSLRHRTRSARRGSMLIAVLAAVLALLAAGSWLLLR